MSHTSQRCLSNAGSGTGLRLPAHSSWNRRDEALTILLDAEHVAPEQIRRHVISRQLVMRWIRQQRGKPSYHLAEPAKWLHVV